jgi:tellurite methyltransferase
MESSAEGTPGAGAAGLDLRAWFGDIDIYLFDLLMKGRLKPPMRILDAGCGTGRNLTYFLRSGFDVHACDEDADALDHVREMASELAPHLPADHFRVERLEAMTWPEGRFEAVICNAVLHFAEDEEQFQRMLDGLWRVLAPGGLFFARLASNIGIEARLERLPNGIYRMPTGGEWFLAGEGKLILATQRLGGELVEPLKTVNVQNLRCMTTWVLRKRKTQAPPA